MDALQPPIGQVLNFLVDRAKKGRFRRRKREQAKTWPGDSNVPQPDEKKIILEDGVFATSINPNRKRGYRTEK